MAVAVAVASGLSLLGVGALALWVGVHVCLPVFVPSLVWLRGHGQTQGLGEDIVGTPDGPASRVPHALSL